MPDRDVFSGVQVTHLGGIEDIDKKSSLTGSCKHVAITDRAWVECNIVVDFGMHQWWGADNALNLDIDPRVVQADYIFITHAHLDHIGRLPMLVSRGFKGTIIMTEATRQLAYQSLQDSANIMLQNQDAKIEQRKRMGREFAEIKKYHTLKEKNDTESQDHVFLAEILEKYGEDKIQKLIESLESVDFNIADLLPEVPVPLYKLEDVNKLFGLKDDAITLSDSELVWSNAQVSWNEDEILKSETVLAQPNMFDQSVVEWYLPSEVEEQESTWYIQTFEYGEDIAFSGIKKHSSLDGITLSIKDIAAKLYPAGHVLWSYQLEVNIWVKNILKWDQVDTAFSQNWNWNHKLWFGWDMGRHDSGNNLWAPSFPSDTYLYREMEWTYAARNHPERDVAIAQLFSTLFQSGKHVLIPTFSIQRTPDMLLLLLDYVETVCQPELDRLKNNTRALREELKNCESLIASYSPDEDEVSITEFQEQKEDLLEEIKENEKEIDRMNITIVTDSLLYQMTQKTYIEQSPEIYEPLTEQSQKKRFWRVIIKNFLPWESKANFERYKETAENPAQDRRTKIIVSSAGMCEGWPVLQHLQRMVENPNSDIIFTWYAPASSLAGKLRLDNEVIILWELYKVKAHIHDITWFSGHAGSDELSAWNKSGKIEKWGVDAIVHGWNDRFVLAHELNKSHKRAAVSCPKLWDTVKIKFPEVKPKKWNTKTRR